MYYFFFDNKDKRRLEMKKRIGLILTGGAGSRLYPLSEGSNTKQFLKLFNGLSLLQLTYLRNLEIFDRKNIYLTTLQGEMANKVAEQITEIDKDFDRNNIIVEPSRKDTGPAIILSIRKLLQLGAGEDDIVVVLPADHYIDDNNAYGKCISDATLFVDNYIGIIGIKPTAPETGYGYIEKGLSVGEGFHSIRSFKEKPELDVAIKYTESEEYLWSSGIYVFSIKTFSNELLAHDNKMLEILSIEEKDLVEKFSQLESISIAFSLIEKSKNIAVFTGDFDWSDVGSFDKLSQVITSRNNVVLENGAEGVCFFGSEDRIVKVSGIKDVILVHKGNVLLIVKRGSSEKVKDLTKLMKSDQKNFGENIHLLENAPIINIKGDHDNFIVAAIDLNIEDLIVTINGKEISIVM